MSDQQNTTSAPAQSDTQQTQVTAQTQATVQQQNTTQQTATPVQSQNSTQQPASAPASQQDASTAPSGSTQETGDKEKIDIKDNDVDYALRMVPTYVQDFMKVNGMMGENEPWMSTRKLKEYLSKAEFTKEQAEALNKYLKDKKARKAEFDAYMKDPTTKKSMKEDYAKAKQAKPEEIVEDKKKEAEQLTQGLQAQVNTLKLDNKRIEAELASLKIKTPPVASMGKAEVTKANGKTKEKDAIIIRDGGKKYVITKDMVKDFRNQKGKDKLPSWKKMKDAAEMGLVSPDIIGKLFNEKGEPKYGKYQEVKPAEVKTDKVELKSTAEVITPSQTTNNTTPVTQPKTQTQTQPELAQVDETTINKKHQIDWSKQLSDYVRNNKGR